MNKKAGRTLHFLCANVHTHRDAKQQTAHAKQHKALFCFFSVLLTVVSPLFCVLPSAAETASVVEINIGIRPSAYKKLIDDESEPVFSVQASFNGGPLYQSKLKLRGSSSKVIGLSTPLKRLPIELNLSDATPAAWTMGNPCLKLYSCMTPFHLAAQYLAYELFDSMDIPTPAHTFAFLQYNSVDSGAYFVLENVNETFIKKQFGQLSGSLYKGADRSSRQQLSSSRWFGGLLPVVDKGNERLRALIDALNRGEGYEQYIDVDEFLRFFACTAVCCTENSILTELTGFFLYDDNGKFILIPWDYSEAFCATETKNGIDHFDLEFWEEAPPCELFNLLMQNESNREKYHAYIKEINDTFLDPAIMDPYFNEISRLLQPYLQRDHTIFINHPYDLPPEPEDIFGTIGSLLKTLHCIYDNLNAQLNGETDVFYVNPFHKEIPPLDEFEALMQFIISNSPGLDFNITDKICAAYPTWCRQFGYIPFDADDPVEIAIAAGVFAVVSAFLIGLARRKRRNKKGG